MRVHPNETREKYYKILVIEYLQSSRCINYLSYPNSVGIVHVKIFSLPALFFQIMVWFGLFGRYSHLTLIKMRGFENIREK